ncbi:hypothetical protein DJ58_4296 [Yersinia frederiksenii ATCC 33641]|uniref:Secreted protein n=1 Tax=Yersinia frederiksenii ATCC 33641 TaxID=349966 RepID=A0ABR4VWL2_YERFR|nr:hypothetical protein DJ58_4296 [Yersinia frederiksenii ATCC 33641]
MNPSNFCLYLFVPGFWCMAVCSHFQLVNPVMIVSGIQPAFHAINAKHLEALHFEFYNHQNSPASLRSREVPHQYLLSLF